MMLVGVNAGRRVWITHVVAFVSLALAALPARSAPPRVTGGPATDPDPALFRDDATLGFFNSHAGPAGIGAVDLDGDGLAELVVGNPMSW